MSSCTPKKISQLTEDTNPTSQDLLITVDAETGENRAVKIENLPGGTPAPHTIASHSDTTATGAELEELTNGSETTLHDHAIDVTCMMQIIFDGTWDDTQVWEDDASWVD